MILWTIIGGVRGVLMAVVGAVLTFGVLLTWNATWDNPRVHKEGVAQGASKERIKWETVMAEARKQIEEDRRKAQAKIDAVEAEYLKQQAIDRAQLMALEILILEMEDHEVVPGCACPPAMPRRLSDELNKVGR